MQQTFRRRDFKFDYAENIERSWDKTTKISFSNMKDFIRSTVDAKIEVLLANYGDAEIVKTKRYHIPGEFLNNINSFIGVNTSFVYYGCAGSFFPYHVEDMNLGSINRHFGGAAKIWISISRRNYDACVRYMK